ncbi:hypothetical protein F5Y04DRAFT_282001 [Hypomontagnella monticulosa]|nr:hypothetical protein F5Y04DRAFT_282001 [Hypomontagnella monticulosa]
MDRIVVRRRLLAIIDEWKWPGANSILIISPFSHNARLPFDRIFPRLGQHGSRPYIRVTGYREEHLTDINDDDIRVALLAVLRSIISQLIDMVINLNSRTFPQERIDGLHAIGANIWTSHLTVPNGIEIIKSLVPDVPHSELYFCFEKLDRITYINDDKPHEVLTGQFSELLCYLVQPRAVGPVGKILWFGYDELIEAAAGQAGRVVIGQPRGFSG